MHAPHERLHDKLGSIGQGLPSTRLEVVRPDGSPVTPGSDRDLLWASIDNDTSRDLDQLSVAEPMAGGAVKVLVAVADVDAVVKRRSAIDDHAQTNTTSVYTAAAIFPMLPERLSTDLTSLGEGVDRLAIVIEMVVEPDGTVKQSDVYRAAVRNRAQLAYNSVAAWLEGAAPAPARVGTAAGLDAQLRLQDRAAATRTTPCASNQRGRPARSTPVSKTCGPPIPTECS